MLTNAQANHLKLLDAFIEGNNTPIPLSLILAPYEVTPAREALEAIGACTFDKRGTGNAWHMTSITEPMGERYHQLLKTGGINTARLWRNDIQILGMSLLGGGKSNREDAMPYVVEYYIKTNNTTIYPWGAELLDLNDYLGTSEGFIWRMLLGTGAPLKFETDTHVRTIDMAGDDVKLLLRMPAKLKDLIDEVAGDSGVASSMLMRALLVAGLQVLGADYE